MCQCKFCNLAICNKFYKNKISNYTKPYKWLTTLTANERANPHQTSTIPSEGPANSIIPQDNSFMKTELNFFILKTFCARKWCHCWRHMPTILSYYCSHKIHTMLFLSNFIAWAFWHAKDFWQATWISVYMDWNSF